jgi:hypothetical protein
MTETRADVKGCQATPSIELEQQLMDVRVPKNEREWWAQREISRLRAENEALRSLLAEIVKAHGTGNLELNSPEIGGHDDIPPHPWHEEWLHHVRAALKETDNG